MATEKFHRYMNYIILIATPIIICATLFFGIKETLEWWGASIPTPDYVQFYERDWAAIINFQNPYPDCFYPPGFLSFSIFYYIYPLLPKVVFCLVWIYTAYYINKLCKKYRVSWKTSSYFVLNLILVHPLYWGITMVSGHYDVTVGLCVLLAVYCMDNSEQIKSGIYVAFAFLLKFLGLILIFPLVFVKKKINWRVGLIFVSICGGVYLVGYFLWGAVVFEPILVHIFRDPEGGSIFTFISEFLGLDVSSIMLMLLVGGMIIVAILLYFMNTDITSFSLILILLFLLILPVVWIHYAAWFLPLAIYWSMTHNGKLQGTIFFYHMGGMAAVLMGFFVVDWMGAVIFFILTLIFALLIFVNRRKDQDKNNNSNDNLG